LEEGSVVSEKFTNSFFSVDLLVNISTNGIGMIGCRLFAWPMEFDIKK
jgi:hypothetical protein